MAAIVVALLGSVVMSPTEAVVRRKRESKRGPNATKTKTAVPRTTTPKAATGRAGFPEVTGGEYGPYLARVAADLDVYWAAAFPAAYPGRRFRTIDAYYAYRPGQLPPPCGNVRIRSYREIANNAFYCSGSDYIAFDDANLFPEIGKDPARGEPALGVVFAHEFGHAIQARAGVDGPTVALEQQADCFAGAWVGRVAAGNAPGLAYSAEELDRALFAVLQISDPIGTNPLRAGAHGNGFDRVNAFQVGFEEGANRCARFDTDPPNVTAMPFTDAADAASGGNLPFSRAVELSRTLLNDWAAQTANIAPIDALLGVSAAEIADVPNTCRNGVVLRPRVLAFCPSDASGQLVLVINRAAVQDSYDRFGDFAFTVTLAEGWAAIVQRSLKRPTAGDRNANGVAASLENDCIVGAFVSDAANRRINADTTLSPGDLDEAIASLILGANAERGRAFARVEALRKGFRSGYRSCIV